MGKEHAENLIITHQVSTFLHNIENHFKEGDEIEQIYTLNRKTLTNACASLKIKLELLSIQSKPSYTVPISLSSVPQSHSSSVFPQDNSSSVDNTNKTTTALSLSSSKNSSETIQTYSSRFFAEETLPNKDDVTAEYKSRAKQQIEAANKRLEQHRNRASSETHSNEHQNTVATYPSEQTSLSLRVQYNSQEIDISAYCLNNTSNLYISLDIEIEPKEEFDLFKEVALRQKILTQDSLGQNGIKIYGLNCLSVKCKQAGGRRLIFLSHKIVGTDDYIYLPYEIVSHVKYERLLNNKQELRTLINNIREKNSVTSIPSITLLNN
ncbi:hypothetical protein BN59_02702 [Legionella massiliensis]|uniref:Uncharacterized protein n=2 Tax=Legionella massiliensis TaxID=1034943 RepID=A0A078KZE7_9GAMM|nr:hypothetical protein BN59_02702 [Legionella massiliensis]CEE14130.1 hypothetical protein BN1094_02702 [Legionella massiliensis]